LKIAHALPDIFKRGYPTIDETATLREAASLLTINKIDALPIRASAKSGGEKDRQYVAISGRGTLSALAKDPSNFISLLDQPSISVAQTLPVVSAEEDLSRLFEAFSTSQFGFAYVLLNNKERAFVSLRDLIPLYRNGVIETSLLLQQVALNKKFAMPSDSTLLHVVLTMIREGHRRVFVDDSESLVTDRMIIRFLSSPAEKNAREPLQARLSDINPVRAKYVYNDLGLKEAMEIFESLEEECIVCNDNIVATLWDATITPWRLQQQEETTTTQKKK
jgi:CBS domain-containing protein